MINRRSLLLLLLFFCLNTLWAAEPLRLDNRYYCDEEQVYAEDIFPDINQSFLVTEFKGRSRLQLSARKLQALFKEQGFDIEPTHPVVLLIKKASFDKAPLKEALTKAFKTHYQNLHIRKITIRARTFFEQGKMQLESIDIPTPNLTKNKGSFTAYYRNKNNRAKKIFFSYTIDADITVLKAKRNLANGTILGRKNSEEARIPFEAMVAPPISTEVLGKVRVRGYVKEGSVITETMIQDIPDIVKNQKVSAILKESGIRVVIYATAQEDGKIGEMIRLKDEAGRTYNARVVDKNKAEIE